jgi:hypothetical protein
MIRSVVAEHLTYPNRLALSALFSALHALLPTSGKMTGQNPTQIVGCIKESSFLKAIGSQYSLTMSSPSIYHGEAEKSPEIARITISRRSLVQA